MRHRGPSWLYVFAAVTGIAFALVIFILLARPLANYPSGGSPASSTSAKPSGLMESLRNSALGRFWQSQTTSDRKPRETKSEGNGVPPPKTATPSPTSPVATPEASLPAAVSPRSRFTRDLGPQEPIARNHDELVNLQRRGDRIYTEFTVLKSRQFQGVGPVSIQLRKVDARHNSYDVGLQVNGSFLEKKHVNLYEPIWITLDRGGTPAQLVVNNMGRNVIWGYLSQPRNGGTERASRVP